MLCNKIQTLLLLVLVFCCFITVCSAEDKKKEKDDGEVKTIYVTATANSTTPEEATTTVEETTPTQTVEVEKLPEYIKFENALEQTEDECMRNIYVVSLNLFYANQINTEGCENGHYNSLDSYRKAKPCGNGSKHQLAIDYMDANVRLMCHTRNTGTYTYEGKMQKELCPILNYMKTNVTKYEDQLYKDCTTNDTCALQILRSYKEIKRIRTELKKSKVIDDDGIFKYVKNENETVTFKMNITDSFFERLEKKCPVFNTITESNAIRATISLSAIIVFSMFMTFIARM